MFRKIYFVLLMLMVGIVADAQLYMVVQMKDHTYKSYEVNDKLKVTWEVDSNSLTTNSPEGTVGMLNGREAIVFDFGSKAGKKAIATMNVGATAVTGDGSIGTLFTCAEASDPEKTGLKDGWKSLDDLDVDAALIQREHHVSEDGTGLYYPISGSDNVLFFPFNTGNSTFRYWLKCSDVGGTTLEYSSILLPSYASGDDKCGLRPICDLPAGSAGGASICIRQGDGDIDYIDLALVQNVVWLPEPEPLPDLTIDSPVGTVGMLDGIVAIVVELEIDDVTRKYAVAMMNYGAKTAEGPYSYGDMVDYLRMGNCEQNQWTIPTSQEMDALAKHLTWNADKKGAVWNFDDTQTSLFMPAAGYGSGTSIDHKDEIGRYWTKNKGKDSDIPYSLNFSADGDPAIAVVDADKGSVRLIRMMTETPTLPQLTYDMPDGTCGTVDGVKAVLVELKENGNTWKYAIMADDYVNGGNTFISYKDATDIKFTGDWHLPTKEEMDMLLARSNVWDANIPGIYFANDNGRYLELKAEGSIDGTTLKGRGTDGYFWTATADGSNNAYALHFSNQGSGTTSVGSNIKMPVRAICKMQMNLPDVLTADSPDGTVGIVGGREAVVVTLNVSGSGEAKYAVATRNQGAIAYAGEMAYGDYSAFGDINGGMYDGWYVPNADEMAALASKFTWNDKDMQAEWQVATNVQLNMPATGSISDGDNNPIGMGYYGRYWVNKTKDENTAYAVEFDNKGSSSIEMNVNDRCVVRPFYKLVTPSLPDLTADSPEGTRGMLGGREAIVVSYTKNNATYKYAIAIMNEGATSEEGSGMYGNKYTQSDAEGLTSDTWRLPKQWEMELLMQNAGWNDNRKGLEIGNSDQRTTLLIPAAGINQNDTDTGVMEEGLYWVDDDNKAFHFSQSGSVKESIDATGKASVRLVSLLTPELSSDSPVGTLGMYHGVEAIVLQDSDGKKYAMAIQNVGATDTQKLGNTYTWWQVQDLSFDDDWYLLDAYKMNAMLNTATKIDDLSDYNLMTLWFNGSRLDFPMTTKITGDYWTSTGDDDVNAISVCFAGGIGPNIFNRSIDKGESFPIRLCHDL